MMQLFLDIQTVFGMLTINKLMRTEAEIRTSGGTLPTLDSSFPKGLMSGVCGDAEVDNIMAELGERRRRARNVVVFGAPENPDGSREERRTATANFISNIFSCLGVSSAVSDISRIGKVAKGKVRSLKRTLRFKEQVKAVLKRTGKLRDSNCYANVRVAFIKLPGSSKKPTSVVKNQLFERLSNAERGLKVLFMSGVPTIVSLN